MGGFPQPNFAPPKTSGGVPQYFGDGSAAGWFPGQPQYNIGMSRMLSDYGSLDPELAQLMSGYGGYGNTLRRQALAKGVGETTSAKDQLAKQFGTNQQAEALASQGLGSGTELGSQTDYNTAMLGTTGIMAEAQHAKADVAGQIKLQQQAIQNAYRQNQIKQLTDMLGLASSAAGSNFGYQQAQMAADRGQISLANAQDAEAQANMKGLMSMLFGNDAPSLFGEGPNSAFGGMSSNSSGFLSSWLGSGSGAAGSAAGSAGASYADIGAGLPM